MVLIPLQGPGPWRGRTTRAVSNRGGNYLKSLVNGYVSGDGHEIRSVPGWTTLVDLTFANNPELGYRRHQFDAIRPVVTARADYSPVYFPYGESPVAATMQSLVATSDESHIHCFEQLRGKLYIIGESLFRKVPIYSNARTQITITTLRVIDGNWTLGASAVVGSYSATDASPSLNGLAAGDVVYVENVTITAAAPSGTQITQAEIDATLNGRFHVVQNAAILRLLTSTSAGDGVMGVTGSVWRTRNNVRDVYSSPNPISPWEPSKYLMIQDPPALTSWVVSEPLEIASTANTRGVRSWVANRRRDFADEQNINPTDGVKLYGLGSTVFRGWSRRQQKPLPYRICPDVAGDRIVLAAPSYACLFQIPAMIPLEPEGWPTQPSTWSETAGRGLLWWANDIYDVPRCLGVPKAILIDSLYANQISPAAGGTPETIPYNFLTYTTASGGFGAGTYKIAVSYEDEVTGEEGLASEPVTITISAGNTRGFQIPYLHPGYVLPESLALRLNVYMAPPGEEAMGFYGSFMLRDIGSADYQISGSYGNLNAQSPDSVLSTVWRIIQLPVYSTTNLVPFIDFTRLAPQSGLQPRGGESVRVIGGILFSVGHSGTHGNVGEVLRSTATLFWSDNINPKRGLSPDEFFIRGFNTDLVQSVTPTAASSQRTDGPFGTGGNYFPSLYQGVEAYAKGLFPLPVQRFRIELIKNNATYNTTGAAGSGNFQGDRPLLLSQRIRVDDSGMLPSPSGTISREGKEINIILPRGQVQVGDPGRPGAVSATAIQFMDAKKDDDGVALGQLGDSLIICSKQETYMLQWFRTPQGQVPKVLSTEFGCVASNSMVTFDVGLAWMSARGPCAVGDGLQWVGEQLEHDFVGTFRRYAFDSRGMMRHCFGAHDESRGLIFWGLVTTDSTHEIDYKGTVGTFDEQNDEGKSRFPCDEVLIWSYRANAFSTWRPPSGLEVLWMRPLRISDGSTRMCFLAADKRIYAFDDAYSDTNPDGFATTATDVGADATSLVVDDAFGIDGDGGAASRDDGTLLRTGMTIVCLRDDKLQWTTTVSALDVDTQTVTLSEAQDWEKGDRLEIGLRPAMTIETTYFGQTADNLPIKGTQMRYVLHGNGSAHVDAKIITSDLNRESPVDVGFTESPRYQPLAAVANSGAFDRIGQRRILQEGFAIGPEVSLSLTIVGRPGVRISELLLETSD